MSDLVTINVTIPKEMLTEEGRVEAMRKIGTPRLGRLYVLGYTDAGADRRLKEIMEECGDLATIVDIRTDTRAARYPGWSQRALREHWGYKYVWKGDSLAEDALDAPCGPAEGIPWLVSFLQRPRSIILLCKCVGDEGSRLAAILGLVMDRLPEVEVIL